MQLIAIGFPPDSRFEGRIMAELAELEFEGNGAGGEEVTEQNLHAFGLSLGQIEPMGESLEPGHSAGFVEHRWALRFKDAVRDAGGFRSARGS